MAATGVMTCRRVISNAERASNISAAPFMDVPTNEFEQDRPVSRYARHHKHKWLKHVTRLHVSDNGAFCRRPATA